MFTIQSYKKGIVTSTALNIIVKGIGFINIIAIAAFFGTSVHTDIYFYIFSLMTMLSGFINGIDLSVIIPEGMLLQAKEGNAAAFRFYNFFGYLYVLIGVVFLLVLLFFSVDIYAAISSFNKNDLIVDKSLLLMSSCLPLLMMLNNYFASVLTTFKYFTAPLIATGIIQLFSLLSLLLVHNKAGINAAIIGLLCGYILNLLVLFIFMRRKLHWQFGFVYTRLSARIKKNLVLVQLGNLSTFAFNYGIILLLGMLGTGALSAYNYGMQIVNIPNIFIVSQVAAVGGIKLNELASANDTGQMNRIFQQSTGLLLFFIMPLCFLSFIYTDALVEILFTRGGFTTAAAASVVFFIKNLIFLAPCFAINTFVGRLMTAGKKIDQAFYFQMGFNLVSLITLYIATRYYQETGFVTAMLCCYYFYISVVCFLLFRYQMNYIKYGSMLTTLLFIILINLPLAFFLYRFVNGATSIGILMLIGFVYYLAVLIINYFFRITASTNELVTGFFSSVLIKYKK